MLVHMSIRMGKRWLVSPCFPTGPAEASLDRPYQALSNMLGQIPKANRLLSDWVLRDLHGPLIGRPGHCFAPSSINAASKSRNSNYSKLASFLAPVSAQADVMAAGGGQAVRAINCTRIDRVTRIPASMIE